jgi:protoporphyrinogen oxidase
VQPQRFDVLILGAGIAGLYAAHRLAGEGRRVAVVERTDRCGGAHRSTSIGPYTFDHGSIFYEDDAPLFDLAEGLLETCPAVMRRQRRIAPSGEVVHYPIEPRDIMRAPKSTLALAGLDLLWRRLFTRRDGTLATILRQRMGRRFLALTGLEHYITRFHHVGPELIDQRFFFNRMAQIARFTQGSAMIKAGFSALRGKRSIQGAPRPPLHIRPYSGYAALFDPIRHQLEERGVTFFFNEDLESVSRTEDGHLVRTSGAEFSTASLVNTIPLDSLHRVLFGEPSGLHLLDMTILFVSAERLDPATGNVLFNFHADGRWKRATIYSRLYPEADTEREFFAVEVTITPGEAHDPEAAFADFARHIEGLGLASGLKLESSAFHPDCYPLYTPGSDERIEQVLAKIAAEDIITVGRQGRFEYLPTSTGVILQVRNQLGLV